MSETDQMNPIAGLIRDARARTISDDIERAKDLVPKLKAARKALAEAEADGAAAVARRRAEFEASQRATDAAQEALRLAELARDATCVPLRAEVAKLTSQLHAPSTGFAHRDPNQWQRVSTAQTPGSDTLRGEYWDPYETHPVGGMNPTFGEFVPIGFVPKKN